MSMHEVVETVVAALADDGFERGTADVGLLDLRQRDAVALRTVQLQWMPPTRLRPRRLPLPRVGHPMVTANLQVDHVACATTFDRQLGAWPPAVDERLGIVVTGTDQWWRLAPPDQVAGWPSSTDAAVLAGDLLDALRTHGLSFLDGAGDPRAAHARGLARHHLDRAVEVAWVAGDRDGARARLDELREVVEEWGRQRTRTPGQQRLVDAVARLEAVVDPD